jgi:protein MpaA
VSERREVVIGQTVLGRPIEAVQFTPPSYAKPRAPAILFGAIHGDDIDLNRNFASSSWGTERRAGYNPGHAPEDQPETQALVALIDQVGATRLVAVHATYRMINWDGTGEELAKKMAELSGYPAERDMGYPCPGSFGTKYGVERGLEVVTVESPYLVADERGWLECRSALRWCVDLPE